MRRARVMLMQVKRKLMAQLSIGADGSFEETFLNIARQFGPQMERCPPTICAKRALFSFMTEVPELRFELPFQSIGQFLCACRIKRA
jgi:hypothetical protein